jgi:hypothetical protein
LSQKSREYILNLDIEKDARLLKERLNICREALDYFCASSSFLKAGVKAGLTLYDIAVMCCRNDNLGEAPSKLEMLFSMASELAESAIENGRWHHAAASRALAEQLNPKGGSLLSSNASKGVPRSMSAFDLPQFSQGLVDLTGATKPLLRDVVPGMVQSSASDSSSDDAGDVDREDCEDCEEWAAALIADVSLEQSIALLHTKQRSPSIESDHSSDSGLSSSPRGFWHIRPGSSAGSSPDSSEASEDEDEDSISWSPPSSPPKNFLDSSASSIPDDQRKSYNPFDQERRSSITMSEMPKEGGDSMFQQFRSPAKVSFAVSLEPTNTKVESAKFKHSNSDVGEPIAHLSKRRESTMKRSQSYSALSSTMAEKVAAEEANTATKISRVSLDHEQYRDYFMKFVDLVIVRETTVAARQANETV